MAAANVGSRHLKSLAEWAARGPLRMDGAPHCKVNF
jgi:hypothetical protein